MSIGSGAARRLVIAGARTSALGIATLGFGMGGAATLLSEKIGLSFWEKADEAHTVARIATSWATTDEQVERLLKELSEHSPCEKS